MESLFFKDPAGFRKWLKKNHAAADELWVGFYKKGSGKASITWPESVDVALCFGWIDGIRKTLDGLSYAIRFTPRRPRSTWSTINVRRVRQLTERGLMHPAGLKAFKASVEKKSGVYSYEQKLREPELEKKYIDAFRKNIQAWEFFQTQPPWYRKKATWWIMSAKKEETRVGRLAKLIEYSAKAKKLT
jgi:uncharacterized protein YdeI (YjbR/CyaY-like superfamily)